MQKKLHIKKGDTVLVIAGKEKGKQGTVLKVYRDSDRALVEGLNIVKKHSKPTAEHPDGGIHDKEAGIHISNLMVMHKGKATRVGRQKDEKTGKLNRVSKKTGEIIE